VITGGWSSDILGALFAISGVFAFGFGLSLLALRGRVSKK